MSFKKNTKKSLKALFHLPVIRITNVKRFIIMYIERSFRFRDKPLFVPTRSRFGECACDASSATWSFKRQVAYCKTEDGFSSSCLVHKEKYYLHKNVGLGQKQVHVSPTKHTQPEHLLHVILTHRKRFGKYSLFCNK